MGRRLPDEVVHRFRIRIEANEYVATIAAAVKVTKKTIYKLRLNLDIWGEPYAPPTVVQGRPKALLPYQEMVIYRSLGRLVHADGSCTISWPNASPNLRLYKSQHHVKLD